MQEFVLLFDRASVREANGVHLVGCRNRRDQEVFTTKPRVVGKVCLRY